MKKQLTKASRHTKGKWSTKLAPTGLFILATREDGKQACLAEMNNFTNGDEWKANAQRIVDCVNACEGINPKAAPEMLEALKEIHDFISQYNYGHPDLTVSIEHKQLEIKAKQAIAKAEGK